MTAVLMGISLASCSKDENPEKGEDGVVINERKLIKLVQTKTWHSEYSNTYTDEYTFKYDDHKLIEVVNTSDNDEYHYTYVWKNDEIKVIYSNYNYDILLENGMVLLYDESECTCDNFNRLVLSEDKENEKRIKIIWDDDKLTSFNLYDKPYYNRDLNMTFTYGNYVCKKGYFPLLSEILEFYEPLFIAHPELIGLRTSKMPTTAHMTESKRGGAVGFYEADENIEYSYEFDKDGYVTKVTETAKDNDGDKTYTHVQELTWE